MVRIPSELADEVGNPVHVLRAWPRGDGSLIVEGREEGTARVRAGRVDARGHASLVPFRTDASLPGLTTEAPTGELLVHRLKRRAVVRTDGHYRKFVAGGKALSVADAHLGAAARLAGSGLTVPDVVATDDSSFTLTAVPGLSLYELGLRLPDAEIAPADAPLAACGGAPEYNQWERAWELWAERWPEFVETGSAGASAIARTHSATDEIATVERWTRLAVATGALQVPEARVRDAMRSVAQSLLVGNSPAGAAHRDLHDKQILADVTAGSVGIIDCDTLAVAEPALDLANLSVHLDFRVIQGMLPAGAAAVGKNQIQAAAESLGVPEARFNAYASATALRLACIYAFRPPYRTTAHTWFTALEADYFSRPLVTATTL